MITTFPEQWLTIPHFRAWQVSDRGHVRRNPVGGRETARLAPLKVTTDGQQYVAVTRGKVEAVFTVDTLVCTAFHGEPKPGMIVQHIDGVIWNNWASNLRWEYEIVASRWYCGPIGPARLGFFRYGPYPSKTELMPHIKYGHVILAKDDNDKVVAFEFMITRDPTNGIRNPYDVSRYWRAAVNTLTEVERCTGMDIMKMDPKDPQSVYEAAYRYRTLASMHPEYMWASYLLEASYYIEMMANMVYHDVAPPPVVVPPRTRRVMSIPPPPPPAKTLPRRRVTPTLFGD